MKFNNLSLLLAVALPLAAQARSASPNVSLTPKRAFVSNGKNSDVVTVAAAAAALADEIPSGGDAGPLSQAADLSEADAPLIADIEMLSNMLAEVVKRENPTVYDLYTRFRKHGMDRAGNPDDFTPFEEMKKLAADVSPIGECFYEKLCLLNYCPCLNVNVYETLLTFSSENRQLGCDEDV